MKIYLKISHFILFLTISIFTLAQNQAMELMKIQTWKGHLKIVFYEKIGEHPNIKESTQTIEGDVTLSAPKSQSGFYFVWPTMLDTSKPWNATLTVKYSETSQCLSDGTNKVLLNECSEKLIGKYRLNISIQGEKLTITPLLAQEFEINLSCKGSTCNGSENDFPMVISFQDSGPLPLPASGTHLTGTTTIDNSDIALKEISKTTFTWDFKPSN